MFLIILVGFVLLRSFFSLLFGEKISRWVFDGRKTVEIIGEGKHGSARGTKGKLALISRRAGFSGGSSGRLRVFPGHSPRRIKTAFGIGAEKIRRSPGNNRRLNRSRLGTFGADTRWPEESEIIVPRGNTSITNRCECSVAGKPCVGTRRDLFTCDPSFLCYADRNGRSPAFPS